MYIFVVLMLLIVQFSGFFHPFLSSIGYRSTPFYVFLLTLLKNKIQLLHTCL